VSKKPTLSPSKITTYLACPSKYYWTYVDPRGKWLIKARSHYSFGTSLHNVLQRFHDSKDTGVQTSEQAIAVLEDTWIEAGYFCAQEMHEALSDARMILTSYFEAHQHEKNEGVPIYVERQFRTDLGPFVLIGRVDRVDEFPDGRIDVVDYKSGRTAVTEKEVKDSVAMCCYQILMEDRHPDRIVTLTIYALRTNASATTRLEPDEMKAFKSDLVRIGTEILERDYELLEPTWKPLCGDCEFVQLCRRSATYRDSIPQTSENAAPSEL
jgi:putative RecB family exonuclease